MIKKIIEFILKIKKQFILEFKRMRFIDWINLLFWMMMIVLGLKLFVIFMVDHIILWSFIMMYFEERGKTEFSEKIILSMKWFVYYCIGLTIAVYGYFMTNQRINVKT